MGLFAGAPIRTGTRIIEYCGERISSKEADRRYEGGPAKHPIVLLFTVNDRTVIDAAVGGNKARYINHSCAPNCESVIRAGRVWIYSLRDIETGEELTYDYNLTIDGGDGVGPKTEYPCRCGSPACRGTMLRLPDASAVA
jgi:SET domain-containing protein